MKKRINHPTMHRKNLIFIIFLFIATLFLGIGYAQISSVELNIGGSVIAQKQTGVVIMDVHYVSNNNANISSSIINSYYQTMLNSKIVLGNDPSSSITYEITIKNLTNASKRFDGAVYEQEFYDNPNITYELNGLSIGDVLASNQSVTFTITYKYTGTDISNNILNSYINFSFNDIETINSYTITYINFENNNYQASINEGEDLTITFSSPVPTNIIVTGSNNYNYSNGILNVYNVASNLIIENLSSYDYPVVEDTGSSTELHTPRVTNTNPVNINDFVEMSFSGKNTTNRNITRIEVTLTYTSTTGSNQSINCELNVGSQQYQQTINLRGKQTNSEAIVTFDGLSIPPGTEFTFNNSVSKLTNSNITISDKKVIFYYQ